MESDLQSKYLLTAQRWPVLPAVEPASSLQCRWPLQADSADAIWPGFCLLQDASPHLVIGLAWMAKNKQGEGRTYKSDKHPPV